MPRLRAVNVEFHICRCGRKHQKTVCPNKNCGKAFDAAEMQRIACLWLIVVAEEVPGYRPVIRYRCQEREKHFRRLAPSADESALAKVKRSKKWDNYCEPPPDPDAPIQCPLCGEQVQRKQSVVWQRRFIHVDSLDAADFDHGRLLTDTRRRKPRPRRDSHD